MTTIGNSFSDIAKKYIQNAPSAGEVSKVTTDTQNYLDQLTSQAVNEVSADNPDYQVEDNGASWQEGVSTVLSGLQGLANSTNQVIQSLSQTASDSDKANEKEYVSKAADDYNKTLDKFNKNPEKNAEALDKAIADATTSVGSLDQNISKLTQENETLNKIVNGDATDLLKGIADGIKDIFAQRNEADTEAKNIEADLGNIASAIQSNDAKIDENGQLVIKVEDIHSCALEGVANEEGVVSLKKSEEADENKTIQQLAGNLSQAKADLSKAQSTKIYKTQVNSDGQETQIEDTAAEQQAVNQAKQKVTQKENEKKQAEEARDNIAKQIDTEKGNLYDIIQQMHSAEERRDALQLKVDDAAQKLEGYINVGEALKRAGIDLDNNQNTALSNQDRNNAMIQTLVDANGKYDGLQSVSQDKIAEAKNQIKENETQINKDQKDKDALNKFIEDAGNAKAENAAKKNPQNSAPQADDKSSTPVDGGDRTSVPDEGNEGAAPAPAPADGDSGSNDAPVGPLADGSQVGRQKLPWEL